MPPWLQQTTGAMAGERICLAVNHHAGASRAWSPLYLVIYMSKMMYKKSNLPGVEAAAARPHHSRRRWRRTTHLAATAPPPPGPLQLAQGCCLPGPNSFSLWNFKSNPSSSVRQILCMYRRCKAVPWTQSKYSEITFRKICNDTGIQPFVEAV